MRLKEIKEIWEEVAVHAYLETIKNDELPLIHYDLLDAIPFVIHGFTTRAGGVSEGIFKSLNLSFTRGDRPEHVRENYRLIGRQIGISSDFFVASDQTHTTNLRVVTADDAGKGITRERDYNDVDGLITNEKGLVLFTYYADCVPLFFVDPVQKAVAVSHSGWRGTVQRMGQVTVEQMCLTFGSRKEDIRCAIGPSICQDCYEVSADLLVEFQKSFTPSQLRLLFWPREQKPDHYELDLWKANEIVLQEAGILPEHIENRRICTCCNKELLFSHRGHEGKRGNLAAFIGIRK